MFNMPGRMTLYEEIDSATVGDIFDQLIERHEALRTRFEELPGGALVQIVDKKSEFSMDVIDLANLSPAEMEQQRVEVYEELAGRIFNLQEGRLIDVKLIKISEQEYDLIFCMHHIISDGWSMDVLKREFLMLYEKGCALRLLRIQYKDFAQWQNQLIESEDFSGRAKAFWASQLSGEVPVLNLPVDYQLKDPDEKTGSAYKIVLSEEIKDRLKEIAGEFHTSLFIVLVTTFITFLSELTAQDDILIGMPTFGRGHEELHGVIGCFVNTTVLRNKVNKEQTFTQLLAEIDKNTLTALDYQDYPLELMMDELNIKYPEISAFFNMLNFHDPEDEGHADLNAEHLGKTQDVKFDLEWYAIEYLNGVQMTCVYNAGLFRSKTIAYIMSSYTKYVAKVSENPNKLLKDYFADDKRRTLF